MYGVRLAPTTEGKQCGRYAPIPEKAPITASYTAAPEKANSRAPFYLRGSSHLLSLYAIIHCKTLNAKRNCI